MPRAAPVTTATLSLSICGVSIRTVSSLRKCSDDPFSGEGVDLRRGQSRFLQDVSRVLAESGRARADRARRLLELHRGGHGSETACPGMFLLHDHAGGAHRGMLNELRVVVDGCAEHVERLQHGHPLVDGAPGHDALEEGAQLLSVRHAVRPRGEARVEGELGMTRRLTEGRPGLVAPYRDEDPAVARLESLVGHEIRMAAAIARQRLAPLVED